MEGQKSNSVNTQDSYVRSSLKKNLELLLQILGTPTDYQIQMQRAEILDQFQVMAEQWCSTVKKRVQSEVDSPKIFAFGSYRYGVYDYEADMDLLCVAPIQFSRDAFFQEFFLMLQKSGKFQNVKLIKNAKIPLIKCLIGGVQVDLLFCQLGSQLVSKNEEFYLNDSIFDQCLDPQSALSLNGLRNSFLILEKVENRIKKFRKLLTIVKQWAKYREIYSSAKGYLGGISFAILVAKIICQYPDLNLCDLIKQFFKTYSQWDWNNPVLLDQNYEIKPNKYKITQWNQDQIKYDYRSNIMPIITSAYPQMNTSHTISFFSFNQIKKEFEQAFNIVQGIFSGEKDWTELITKQDNFLNFSQFIQINTIATNYQNLNHWSTFVESQLRKLVYELDEFRSEFDEIKLITKSYARPYKIQLFYRCCRTFFIGIKFKNQANNLQMSPEASYAIQHSIQNFKSFLTKSQYLDKKFVDIELIPRVMLIPEDIQGQNYYEMYDLWMRKNEYMQVKQKFCYARNPRKNSDSSDSKTLQKQSTQTSFNEDNLSEKEDQDNVTLIKQNESNVDLTVNQPKNQQETLNQNESESKQKYLDSKMMSDSSEAKRQMMQEQFYSQQQQPKFTANQSYQLPETSYQGQEPTQKIFNSNSQDKTWQSKQSYQCQVEDYQITPRQKEIFNRFQSSQRPIQSRNPRSNNYPDQLWKNENQVYKRKNVKQELESAQIFHQENRVNFSKCTYFNQKC